ncbi:RNA polymerase sigma factor [Ferruginibacter yonginensis]|uniref:RNA polymerase sigma factor n=1 Tax=Ferruginibacter yonginensis TaxID=1310416 RepID=A0ABV8QRM9_9BACT
MTDGEIIKGCIKGEAHCQRSLFNRYASSLLGVSQRYARNKEDAEDILQDAFVKIFKKIEQFKGDGSFEGWMRRIVVNTALKKYTVSRYTKEFSVDEIKENAMADVTDVPAFNHLGEKDLLALINNLPDGYRIIFNLYVIEGFQHDEIAEMLGIQPGTSRSQLVKARMLLQKEIIQLQKVAV